MVTGRLNTDSSDRLMIQSAPMVAYRADRDMNRIEEVNDFAVELLGYTKTQWCEPHFWYNVTHPADRKRVLSTRHQPDDDQRGLMYRLVRNNGAVVWVRDRYTERSDGTTVGWLIDITSQQREVENLREQLRMLQTCSNNLAGTALYQFVLKRNGNNYYSFVSHGIEQVSGITAEELLSGSKKLRDCLTPEDRERIVEMTRESAENLSIFEMHLHATTPQGEKKYWHFRSAPHRTADGTVIWDGVIWDNTNQHKSDELRKKLENKIQDSQRYETLGVLAGGVAHDFNNLLTGVLGYADLASQTIDPDNPAHDHLVEIRQAAQRAADLCQQMLGYAGRGRIVTGTIDLNQLVNEMSRLLRTAVSKKTQIVLDLCDPGPIVEGDATQVRQIIMNLITNASEALEGSPGTVNLRTGIFNPKSSYFVNTVLPPEKIASRYAFIEVQDHGVGMSQETLARIFDPFFTTKFTGRGLGLASLLGSVRSHGGAVHVVTAPGEGSTFRVMFPSANLRHQPIRTTPLSVCVEGKGRVLVVDDEPAIRKFSQEVLQRSGYQVLLAQDGQEAVDLCQHLPNSMDVIIMDLTMPRLTGPEAINKIRGLGVSVPVILMSGYSEQEVKIEHSIDNYSGYIQKPFQVRDLVKSIQRVLIPGKN